MTVLLKHLLQQAPVLKALLHTFRAAQQQRKSTEPARIPPTPGDIISQTLKPRSNALISDFIKHVGGTPKQYQSTVPAYLFPQWTFGLASQLLIGLPYPLMRIVNGGCRLEVNQHVPRDEELLITAQLTNIDDNGRRAVMTQQLITGTKSASQAIDARMYAIVPLGRKDAPTNKKKKEKARVPDDAKLLTEWRLQKNAGLQFAALTGDFNPIHWIPAAARANGFKNTILHGFSTMARSIEGIKTHHLLDGGTLRWIDVQFTRPLVLPCKVGLFIRITDTEHHVYVGDAAGGPAYMTGTFEVAQHGQPGL